METSLEEIPAPALSEADVPCVSSMSLSDPACETRLLFRDRDQVSMIAHQAPGQIVNAESLSLFGEELEVGEPVIIGEEDVHPSHTALNDVMRQTRADNTRDASHAQILS